MAVVGMCAERASAGDPPAPAPAPSQLGVEGEDSPHVLAVADAADSVMGVLRDEDVVLEALARGQQRLRLHFIEAGSVRRRRSLFGTRAAKHRLVVAQAQGERAEGSLEAIMKTGKTFGLLYKQCERVVRGLHAHTPAAPSPAASACLASSRARGGGAGSCSPRTSCGTLSRSWRTVT